MTISRTAWTSFLNKYGRCIQPDRETGQTAKEVDDKVGITLCVDDILAKLRGTSISYYRDYDGGVQHSTCMRFVETVFEDVFMTLTNTDVNTYVVCIDAYGRRPPEKAATTAKRSKRARPEEAPEQLPIPAGQSFYFLDHQPMPGPINLIFDTPAAKREFYVYITLFFTLDKTRLLIPPGKRIILSGGAMELEDGFTNMPPIEVTRKKFKIRHEWASPHVGEGDIDVWTWVYRFHDMNFHVISHDADVVLIGLLQMRRLLEKYPTRQGWVVTRRSVATEAVDTSYQANLAKRHCLRKELYDTVLAQTQDRTQAYIAAGASFASSSSSEPSTARRPCWVRYHIDIVRVYQDIIEDAQQHISAANKCPNLVEIYVLAFILSSEEHDYIQTKELSRNVGSHYVWSTFDQYMYNFSSLVKVYELSSLGDFPIFYYSVNKQVLAELVRAFYYEKAKASIKAENKTHAQLVKAQQKSFTSNLEKNGPSDERIWVVAAQCAWLLQYWGNGPVPGYKSVDGTDVDEDGHSVYGYTPTGWAETVYQHGIKRICPPIPTA